MYYCIKNVIVRVHLISWIKSLVCQKIESTLSLSLLEENEFALICSVIEYADYQTPSFSFSHEIRLRYIFLYIMKFGLLTHLYLYCQI